ncbi:MAG: thiamine pyrophosphate-binding protein, partial [Burkholderiales bacterium]
MVESKNIAKSAAAGGRIKMTPSEAFVETLVAQGVKETFGIVGSAYMDAHDLFPLAGIRFVSVAHEQNAAHMADGYSRVTGKHGVCIAQNGPGITNFVTGIAAAYWAHTPVVAITPESGSMTMGLGGFQETEQMPIFSKITKWQVHVNSPMRMAELTSRAFDIAMAERGPVQVNIPRDYFYGEGDFE